MSEMPLLVRWQGPVCRLTLNRPAQGNALSALLVRLFDEAVAQATARQAQVLVIEAAGQHFCTGFDLSGLDAETDDSLLARFVRIELLLQRIARAPFATVAVAHGRTMGAGADLFACCSLRLVRDDAVFAFPGMQGFGLLLGSARLMALVGARKALPWIQTACAIPADEALQAGLASQITDANGVVAAIEQQLTAAGCSSPGQRQALWRAAHGEAASADARDLDLLVRSAAQAGLRQRITAYLHTRVAARKEPASPST